MLVKPALTGSSKRECLGLPVIQSQASEESLAVKNPAVILLPFKAMEPQTQHVPAGCPLSQVEGLVLLPQPVLERCLYRLSSLIQHNKAAR